MAAPVHFFTTSTIPKWKFDVNQSNDLEIARIYRMRYTICMSRLISIRMDEELLARVDKVRRKEKLSRARAIQLALTSWLDQKRWQEAVLRDQAGYERWPEVDDEFGSVMRAQEWPK